MGISANKLYYDFCRKLNASNTGQGQDYRIVDITAYLNEALEIWYENKIATADTNAKVRDDLRVYEIKKQKLTLSHDSECSIATYPEDFYRLINILVETCNKECCPGIKKFIEPKIVQGDDLQRARKDTSWKSDFLWEQLIADDAGQGMYLYHEGEMQIVEVLIDYYRKPQPIHSPELDICGGRSFSDYDGKPIIFQSNFEVDQTYANRQVSDIAVLLATRDSGDMSGYQTQLQKIFQIDNLYR